MQMMPPTLLFPCRNLNLALIQLALVERAEVGFVVRRLEVATSSKYPCPGYNDHFDTISGHVAHTESQSIRCQFSHSKNYGTFLSQALAGDVDVVGEDMEYGMVQFAISKEAKRELWCRHPSPRRDAVALDEFKAATAALQQRAVDESASGVCFQRLAEMPISMYRPPTSLSENNASTRRKLGLLQHCSTSDHVEGGSTVESSAPPTSLTLRGDGGADRAVELSVTGGPRDEYRT
ncbi:hypothetical protein CONLIGDRAFT_675075 [Coniochaeta ligniaria NRRL 30616]|uniref:Uncharacterized protein n=1 Tax=Coniochaeta ligniaria NRRL 30616 TaxID=1408157 RepID=A0A1J7IMT8_9PEZI|nr:hypothetical protein CONLIGDRAFT_675075 [Coniochaeta ligniaria NRRL 30616]